MSVLPQDETGKAEHGYDYDFEMPKTAIYVDDGFGGVELWDGVVDIGTGDLTVTMGDVEKLLAGTYWKDQRLEYSSGDLIYVGMHTTHKVATSDTNWYIVKLTWTSGDLVRLEGPLVGEWDDKEGLSWA